MGIVIKSVGLTKALQSFRALQETILSDKLLDFIAEKAIEEINKDAIEKLDRSDNYIANNKYEKIDKGVVIYNDSKSEDGTYYSLILEYGSGIYAEGEPFHHTQTYDETGGLYWLVPIEEGSSLFSTDYDIITLEAGDFFKVYGQPAKHIYTDAAKKIRKNIASWVSQFIESEMK